MVPRWVPEPIGPSDLVKRCRVLSERVAQHNRRMKADEQALGSDIDAVYRELKSQMVGAGEETLEELELAKKIYEGQGPGGDLRIMSSATKQTPIMLKFLLGRETAGVLIRYDQRLRLKREYFKFRHNAALIFRSSPSCCPLGSGGPPRWRPPESRAAFPPPLGAPLRPTPRGSSTFTSPWRSGRTSS